MIKYLMLGIAVIGLSSCSDKDEHYYRSHPKELRAELQHCEEIKTRRVPCQKLEEIADQMNRLAYQLQLSPQGFGAKILELQQEIAKQQEQLKKEDANKQVRQSLEANQQRLADLMAVVKWLESPEG